MAVTATKNPSGLKIRFDCGLDDVTGKTKIKSKTYSNVDPEATNDDVYAVGAVIASLQNNTLLEVAIIDNTTLSE
ncbi:DUF1659 domain-containing protein [Romboutsia sp. 1001216sp1]|uniref:DUF1659 domain-containing protein n=1 Tax=Romboutsia sp. 1001216sp1 TaxID=2986997 RepID=UPI0023310C61|nr:DUF1659 domain-containing protein [Romboutsia sp. 1001216sp1]MDB8804794.1 DUF1659 domain-containing protein [Romboutsia sp. 1001216sp1]MDB8808109.1 DUF1659 domain-containing protein [Romboutsia sp. 1001216sp1]MDB8810440.1 DUF1659 domain-containing protein [Romboutsia sp. 1001216sp1]MDB8816159.1 DUF1659 domain-containing protein [Romboutsia sp. 1001216sp1]MDB8818887.1 DUF1659 domain-containing protein [Romboutsia sp. 1001216sp1]